MTFAATRHHLPAPLVAADEPLSADVMARSVEAIAYAWQVTTGCTDRTGTATTVAQGHTHDGVRDQALFAESEVLVGWPCGFGSPHLRGDSSQSPDPVQPHYLTNGGWADGTATLVPVRAMIFVPFDLAGAVGTSAKVRAFVLIEKGQALSAPAAVVVDVLIDGVLKTGTSAVAAVGLEAVQVGDWPAGALAAGGENSLEVRITVPSGDLARVWHAAVLPV